VVSVEASGGGERGRRGLSEEQQDAGKEEQWDAEQREPVISVTSFNARDI